MGKLTKQGQRKLHPVAQPTGNRFVRGVIVTFLCSILLILQPICAAKSIGSVTIIQNQCGKVTMSIGLDSNWKAMPAKNKPIYTISKYNTDRTLSKVKDSNDPAIAVEWPEGKYFKFIVEARSRQANNIGVTMYRLVSEIEGIAASCSSYVPAAGEVRLRHEQTGKCMFGNPNPGGAAGVFTCWKDPNMGYLLDPLSSTEFRIRHRSTNQCLYVDTPNGGVVKNWPCGVDPKMVWIKDALPGNNRFRIRNKATDRCIYARNSEGAPVQAWGPCWDDPAMVWVIEPF